MKKKVPHYRIKLLESPNPNKMYGIIVSDKKGGKGSWLVTDMETKRRWFSNKESAMREVKRKRERWRCTC